MMRRWHAQSQSARFRSSVLSATRWISRLPTSLLTFGHPRHRAPQRLSFRAGTTGCTGLMSWLCVSRRIGQRAVEDRAQELDWLGKRLFAASPDATLRRQHDSLRENRSRLVGRYEAAIVRARGAKPRLLQGGLMQQSPALAVQRSSQRPCLPSDNAWRPPRMTGLQNLSHRIALLGRALNSVSPLATLDRGYAIVQGCRWQGAHGCIRRQTTGMKYVHDCQKVNWWPMSQR